MSLADVCQVQKNGIPMEEEEEEEEESLGNDGTANGMEAPQVGRGPQTTVLRNQIVYTATLEHFDAALDHFDRLGIILSGWGTF